MNFFAQHQIASAEVGLLFDLPLPAYVRKMVACPDKGNLLGEFIGWVELQLKKSVDEASAQTWNRSVASASGRPSIRDATLDELAKQLPVQCLSFRQRTALLKYFLRPFRTLELLGNMLTEAVRFPVQATWVDGSADRKRSLCLTIRSVPVNCLHGFVPEGPFLKILLELASIYLQGRAETIDVAVEAISPYPVLGFESESELRLGCNTWFSSSDEEVATRSVKISRYETSIVLWEIYRDTENASGGCCQ